jgi:hypothetical protein
MSKAIITAAITGGIHTPTMSPYLPVTPKEIADEAVRACEAGAAVAHIHVRDPETGQPSPSMDLYREVGMLVCANVGSPKIPGGLFFTKICHFVRETADGVEMRSRFWVGQDIVKEGKKADALMNRLLHTRVFKKRALPRVARHVAHHCAAEYTHLASLLHQEPAVRKPVRCGRQWNPAAPC